MKVRGKRSERTHTESDGTKGNCVFDGSQVCYTDGPQTWQVAFGLMVSSLTSGLCVCLFVLLPYTSLGKGIQYFAFLLQMDTGKSKRLIFTPPEHCSWLTLIKIKWLS